MSKLESYIVKKSEIGSRLEKIFTKKYREHLNDDREAGMRCSYMVSKR